MGSDSPKVQIQLDGREKGEGGRRGEKKGEKRKKKRRGKRRRKEDSMSCRFRAFRRTTSRSMHKQGLILLSAALIRNSNR